MRLQFLTFLSFTFLLFFSEKISALHTTINRDSIVPGVIVFESPSAIDSLEHRMRGRVDIKGYRIQVFLGSYSEAKNFRAKFLTTGIPIPAYIQQNTPDYVVKVGDFRNLLEANKYFSEIKQQYPGAFIVADKIEPVRSVRSMD